MRMNRKQRRLLKKKISDFHSQIDPCGIFFTMLIITNPG